MKRIGKQKTSSFNPSTTQKKKKNNFEQQPFTVPTHQAPVTDPITDLSEYRQPQPGETIANVMRSMSAGTANKPAFTHKRQGNELTAPLRQNYQPIINPIRQLTAPRQDSNRKGQIVQPKLTIGRPNDKYEQEADSVAAQVVRQINRPAPMSRAESGMVQGKEEEEGLRMKPMPGISEIEAKPEEGELQKKPMVQGREAIGGGEASPELSGEINRARGGGQPLAPGLQQSMGQAMGADFSGVRVHTDGRADRLNRALSARAFTTGLDLFFKKGEYQPGSREGQGLIAHELTHVVQQTRSSDNMDTDLTIIPYFRIQDTEAGEIIQSATYIIGEPRKSGVDFPALAARLLEKKTGEVATSFFNAPRLEKETGGFISSLFRSVIGVNKEDVYLIGHGRGDSLMGHSAVDVAAQLMSIGYTHENINKIILVSCLTGASEEHLEETIARELAQIMKVDVYAPYDLITVEYDIGQGFMPKNTPTHFRIRGEEVEVVDGQDLQRFEPNGVGYAPPV